LNMGGATESVRNLMRNAYWAHRAARVAECGMVGVGAFLITLAAACASDGALDSAGPWVLAALASGAGAASYWLEVRPNQARLARAIDRRLRLSGGLLTAFECERAAPQAAFSVLVARHVLARVAPRAVVRAGLPNSAPFLALPFLGAGVLALALDARVPQRDAQWRGAQHLGCLRVGACHFLIEGGLGDAREIGRKAHAQGDHRHAADRRQLRIGRGVLLRDRRE